MKYCILEFPIEDTVYLDENFMEKRSTSKLYHALYISSMGGTPEIAIQLYARSKGIDLDDGFKIALLLGRQLYLCHYMVYGSANSCGLCYGEVYTEPISECLDVIDLTEVLK